MTQQQLLEPVPAGSAAAALAEPEPPRLSSKGIAPGDIVLVDKRGRRFHAEVVALEQRESGRYELDVRPLDRRITYRTATVREVVDVWRRVRRQRPPDGDGTSAAALFA